MERKESGKRKEGGKGRQEQWRRKVKTKDGKGRNRQWRGREQRGNTITSLLNDSWFGT